WDGFAAIVSPAWLAPAPTATRADTDSSPRLTVTLRHWRGKWPTGPPGGLAPGCPFAVRMRVSQYDHSTIPMPHWYEHTFPGLNCQCQLANCASAPHSWPPARRWVCQGRNRGIGCPPVGGAPRGARESRRRVDERPAAPENGARLRQTSGAGARDTGGSS